MSQETVKDKWMEYAVNEERQEISEGGREMAQYIRDLYNSGAKLWTKEIFRSVEADLGREPRPQDIVVRSSMHFWDNLFLSLVSPLLIIRVISEWGAKSQTDSFRR